MSERTREVVIFIDKWPHSQGLGHTCGCASRARPRDTPLALGRAMRLRGSRSTCARRALGRDPDSTACVSTFTPRDHPESPADGRSRVGRRRGTAITALFRRPPSERCVQVSKHTALQSPRSRAGRRSASRIPPRPPAADLLPFALCVALPRALVGRDPDDYYGSSVALGLAPGRPSRVPSPIDVRARRRCPVRPLARGHSALPARRRVHAPATLARYPGGPASDTLRGTCPCIAGDWGSGSLPFTISRGSRESRPYVSSGRSRFPTMLLSPLAFTARLGGRPRSHKPPNFSPLRGGSMTG